MEEVKEFKIKSDSGKGRASPKIFGSVTEAQYFIDKKRGLGKI